MMEEKQLFNQLMAWVQRDMIYIILMILVLGACAYTLMHTDNINDSCNEHWVQQWKQSSCRIDPYNNFTELDVNIVNKYLEGETT